MNAFTLKGGNALQYAHDIQSRSSLDIDLSMSGDFEPGELDSIKEKLETSLQSVFADDGIHVFDVKLEERPESIKPELSEFWGGYKAYFKLITQERANELNWEATRMQRAAISISSNDKKSIFTVDISKHEYCGDRVEFDIDGYSAYSYSLPMILFEKLRAICQQTHEYRQEVLPTHSPRSRARDFLDMYNVMQRETVPVNEYTVEMCRKVFEAKRVPMGYLDIIGSSDCREFHRETWEAVLSTTSNRESLESFDYYFDFVISLADSVKGFWVK